MPYTTEDHEHVVRLSEHQAKMIPIRMIILILQEDIRKASQAYSVAYSNLNIKSNIKPERLKQARWWLLGELQKQVERMEQRLKVQQTKQQAAQQQETQQSLQIMQEKHKQESINEEKIWEITDGLRELQNELLLLLKHINQLEKRLKQMQLLDEELQPLHKQLKQNDPDNLLPEFLRRQTQEKQEQQKLQRDLEAKQKEKADNEQTLQQLLLKRQEWRDILQEMQHNKVTRLLSELEQKQEQWQQQIDSKIKQQWQCFLLKTEAQLVLQWLDVWHENETTQSDAKQHNRPARWLNHYFLSLPRRLSEHENAIQASQHELDIEHISLTFTAEEQYLHFSGETIIESDQYSCSFTLYDPHLHNLIVCNALVLRLSSLQLDAMPTISCVNPGMIKPNSVSKAQCEVKINLSSELNHKQLKEIIHALTEQYKECEKMIMQNMGQLQLIGEPEPTLSPSLQKIIYPPQKPVIQLLNLAKALVIQAESNKMETPKAGTPKVSTPSNLGKVIDLLNPLSPRNKNTAPNTITQNSARKEPTQDANKQPEQRVEELNRSSSAEFHKENKEKKRDKRSVSIMSPPERSNSDGNAKALLEKEHGSNNSSHSGSTSNHSDESHHSSSGSGSSNSQGSDPEGDDDQHSQPLGISTSLNFPPSEPVAIPKRPSTPRIFSNTAHHRPQSSGSHLVGNSSTRSSTSVSPADSPRLKAGQSKGNVSEWGQYGSKNQPPSSGKSSKPPMPRVDNAPPANPAAAAVKTALGSLSLTF